MTEKLHYDYSSTENEEQSWLYVAELEEGLPEPHCYKEVFTATGVEAVEIINNFESLSGDQAQEYAKRLAYG